MSSLLLDPNVLGYALGWRAAFGLGAILAIAILLVRRNVPESPRWLMVRGRNAEALAIVTAIERECPRIADVPPLHRIRIVAGQHIGFRRVADVIFRQYRARALLGLALMVSQAFF